MEIRTLKMAILASLAAASLCACSAGASDSTVEVLADYPSFDKEGLIAEASLIVEGVAVSAEYTVLTPRYEGETAEENPLLGLTEEEQKDAMAQDEGVAATAVTFRVDVVHRGSVRQGEEVVIVQTGGVIDGVRYHVAEEVTLEPDSRYLLFGTDRFDGAYNILGGSAGTYLGEGDGEYVAANPDSAPFARLTASELSSLLE